MLDFENCDFLILCGGKGTRLKSELPGVPKLLVKINNKPLIEYIIEHIEKFKIEEIILCTGYLHKKIEGWFEKFYNGKIKIKFSKEDFPLGTGGAVKNAINHISGKNFFVINGDTYCPLNYEKMFDIFNLTRSQVLMGLINTNDNERYGSVSLDSKNNIIGFIEKEKKVRGSKKNFLLNTGCYLFDKTIVKKLKSGTSSLELDFFPMISKDKNVAFMGHVFDEKFIDIGTPESYVQSQKYFKNIE